MLKISLKRISFLSTILLFAMNLAWAYQNMPDGFRGDKWDKNVADFSGLKLEENKGLRKDYVKENEDLNFEGIKLSKITYEFLSDKLYGVTLKIDGADLKKFTEILQAKYGPPKTDKEILVWAGGKTEIRFKSQNPEQAELNIRNTVYDIPAEYRQGFMQKLGTAYRDILTKYKPIEERKTMLDRWLARNGAGIIDRFYLSENGSVMFVFKDGANFFIDVQPQNTKGK